MQVELVSRPVFLRHTSADGKSHVVEHLTWDADRFLASQQRAAEKVNTEARSATPPTPALAKVEQITQDQYRKERQAKK